MGAESQVKSDLYLQGLGRHLIGELSGCRPEVLGDVVFLTQVMRDAAVKAGAHVIGNFSKRFESGGGVSVVVVIQESHLSIHTWPEHNYAALDIFTCGERVDPWIAFNFVVKSINPSSVNVVEVRRGLAFTENHKSFKASARVGT